jgi:hypothetical protein
VSLLPLRFELEVIYDTPWTIEEATLTLPDNLDDQKFDWRWIVNISQGGLGAHGFIRDVEPVELNATKRAEHLNVLFFGRAGWQGCSWLQFQDRIMSFPENVIKASVSLRTSLTHKFECALMLHTATLRAEIAKARKKKIPLEYLQMEVLNT